MTYYKRPAPGQATMANSEPVVIASNQTAISVTDTNHQTQDAVFVPGTVAIAGGVRKDSDTTPVSADGDVHPFVFEETGRLKVASYPGSIPVYTDTITSNGDTVSLDVSRYSNLTIHCTGTFSTVNVTFEGSVDGGTTWFDTQGVRTNANTVELTTGNLSAAPAYAWEFSVNALTNFRVRATAYTSGTQTWYFSPGTYATEPIPAIQTHAVTGSGNFAVTMAANATTTPAKARDDAAGASDTGIPNFFVRRDAPTAVTPAAGDYEIPQITNLGAQYVAPVAHTAGGATPYKLVSAASTNATSVKASAGQVYMITASNVNAAVRYLKLYNKASAPTVGTDTPVFTFAIPGNTAGAGTNIPVPAVGLAFSTGIAFALTTEATDAGTTGVAASEIVINLAYL